MKMKIGIITFWWSEENYGQLLQYYALQKYLCDAGHKAYLIRYDPRHDHDRIARLKALKRITAGKLVKYLAAIRDAKKEKEEQKRHNRNFSQFREKYFFQTKRIYYSCNELAEDPPEADAYITGSDQVWNFSFWCRKTDRRKAPLMAYMLDFCPPGKKRIAYAASFGKSQLENEYAEDFSRLITKFDYVSVREKSALNICNESGVNADWVIDPVMMLDVSDYHQLSSEGYSKNKCNKHYCFLYMLEMSVRTEKIITAFMCQSNKEIIYASAGHYRKTKFARYYPDIHEWLSYIEYADYIITNSFHGVVFSILFQKQFIALPLEICPERNERIISLLELFGIKERFTDDMQTGFSILNKPVDREQINRILMQERHKSRLLSMLN